MLSNDVTFYYRHLEEIEELKKKLAEEKKQRNDRHVAHRNEVGILRAENDDLKKRVCYSLICYSVTRSAFNSGCVLIYPFFVCATFVLF